MGDCTTGEQRARRTAVFNFGASRSDLGDVQMNAEKTGCVSASGAESNTAYRLSCLYDGGGGLLFDFCLISSVLATGGGGGGIFLPAGGGGGGTCSYSLLRLWSD